MPKRITDLTALAQADIVPATDLIPVWDNSAAATRKSSISSIVAASGALFTSYHALVYSYTGTLNALKYATFGAVDALTNADLIRLVFPFDVVMDRAYLRYNTRDTSSNNGKITIYKDGVATDLSCALSGSPTGQRGGVSDVTHSVSFTAGTNECSILLDPGSGNLQNFAFSVRVQIV